MTINPLGQMQGPRFWYYVYLIHPMINAPNFDPKLLDPLEIDISSHCDCQYCLPIVMSQLKVRSSIMAFLGWHIQCQYRNGIKFARWDRR